MVCFQVEGQQFGLPIGVVKETIERKPVARLFLVPDFVAGLINLRGEVVAVLELARLLGLSRRPDGLDRPASVLPTIDGPTEPLEGHHHPVDETRIIILRGAGTARAPAAGLLVDRMGSVRSIEPAEVRPVPSTLPSGAAAFLRGLARTDGQPLLLLDLDRILNCDQLKPFRQHR
jgi:purine-binding chemotaxis protein CheW